MSKGSGRYPFLFFPEEIYKEIPQEKVEKLLNKLLEDTKLLRDEGLYFKIKGEEWEEIKEEKIVWTAAGWFPSKGYRTYDDFKKWQEINGMNRRANFYMDGILSIEGIEGFYYCSGVWIPEKKRIKKKKLLDIIERIEEEVNTILSIK